MKVNLNVILEAIEMADDNYTYFLDLETGESVFLVDELVTGLDNKGLDHEIKKAEELGYAIRGRGAFRRFDDMIDRMGITQQWYNF